MRNVRGVRALVALALLLGAAACKDSNEPGGDPIDTPLDPCVTQPCGLPLDEQARFEVTLLSHSCAAHDNEIHVIAPESERLTDDACYEEVGKVWAFEGPYAAGTTLNFRIDSFEQLNPPSFVSSGAYPEWTLTFEDGGDSDFNDIVLRVRAIPTP
ncbi:MAG TPA: hypothetical protein VFT04_01560 [Gemmatimonadales bacterium]|nr:hypothetical protein [Gemmatimonadales bacterium]